MNAREWAAPLTFSLANDERVRRPAGPVAGAPRHGHPRAVQAQELVVVRHAARRRLPEVLVHGLDGGEGHLALALEQALHGALVAGVLVAGGARRRLLAQRAQLGVLFLCGE